MLSFEQAGTILDDAVDALPEGIYDDLNGGVNLLPDRRISEDGRFVCNLYFAYSGALAMFQVGGRAWKKAFVPLREFLIATQSRGDQGHPHESGSWLFYDRYLNDGGRLLNTALSVLILETPYRYLPMYVKK